MHFTSIPVNLTTDLRLLKLENASALFELVDANRHHLRQWLPWLDYNTEAIHSFDFIKQTQKQFADKTGFVMGIWFNERLVGVIGHNRIDWTNKISYIGYWLGESAQGNGIVTSSCRAMIQHAFDDLKLNRVEIGCATGNARSCAIPERLGFTHEGVRRQRERLYDRFVDHQIYGLLADEWRAKMAE